MKKILFIILIPFIINSQTKTEYFPKEILIQPFTANFIEPKAGFSFQLGERELRLDIGTTTDFVHFTYSKSNLSFGADLFTYTRLRGENEFHFPVDAVDYLFGINAGFIIKNNNKEYGFRFRLSHISAHFVDGHFDGTTQTWKEGRDPIVYSREFLEIFPFYRINGFRFYSGYTYIYNTSPEFIGRHIFQSGFDWYLPDFISKNVTPYFAYDFKLNKIYVLKGNNILTAGIKFGNWNSKGFTIAVSHFAGKSVHGEYFDLFEQYTTLGFNIDI